MTLRIHADVDDADVRKLLAQLQARGKRPPLRRIAVVGIRSILRNFREEGRPKKWESLKSQFAYRRGKKIDRGSGKILQDTGRLRQSTEVEYRVPANVKLFSSLIYARTHQYGWKERNIPARPFMLWQSEDVRSIQQILLDHLTKARS